MICGYRVYVNAIQWSVAVEEKSFIFCVVADHLIYDICLKWLNTSLNSDMSLCQQGKPIF